MGKAFVTGRGLVTPLGTGLAANERALRDGRSGIVRVDEFVSHQLESLVGGQADENPPTSLIDRKTLRFCPATGVMSVAAVSEALAEAGIAPEEIPQLRIAVIGGVAGSNYREVYRETRKFEDTGRLRTVSPYVVPRVMPSSAISNLSLVFGFKGESYDVSAACSSSALAIMVAVRMIRGGLYDVVVAGGAEQLDWVQALGFNAIRALSRRFNDRPELASRPFDSDRDGFVLASGAGYVILESERSVARRGVRPVCEISGVASNSNASDMVVPDAASCMDVMRHAVADAGLRPSDITYVNTHGTATPVGDPVEMAALREVFGGAAAINSTKSQTGHMVGATGAAEIIFTSIMMEKRFLSRSINLDNPEPEFGWADLIREYREGVRTRHALSNSFAFGGSNISVVISDCGD